MSVSVAAAGLLRPRADRGDPSDRRRAFARRASRSTAAGCGHCSAQRSPRSCRPLPGDPDLRRRGGGKVVGFIQASRPAAAASTSAGAADAPGAEPLVADGADTDEVARRLDRAPLQPGARAWRPRLFVRLPERDPLLPSSAARLPPVRDGGASSTRTSPDAGRALSRGARPRPPRGQPGLYQLYRKVTPQAGRQLEAPNYREWRALHGGWSGAARCARLGEQRAVVVDRIELVGWVKAERARGRGRTRSASWRSRGHLPGELADLACRLLGRRRPARPGRASATMIRT